MKVTIVGAGSVGASCAEYIAIKNFVSELVLIDIKKDFVEGKVMDLMQMGSLNNFDTRILGSAGDYSRSADSDVAVISCGIPRKPGMTREELIGINASIVKEVVEKIIKYSPHVIIIIVSNPVDTMTYLAHKITKFSKNKIIGMGGALDSARFKYYLASALEAPLSEINGMVIGAHSDTGMIPLIRYATRSSIPVSQFLSDAEMEEIVQSTMVGGATLTRMLGTSAWYAPGAVVSAMVESIALDSKKIFPCSAYLDGAYGAFDICLGVPCILGADGIEKIIDIKLNEVELDKFSASTEVVRDVNKLLKI